MTTKYDIGFEAALSLTLERLFPLNAVDIPIGESCGFATAEDCCALVDCPSTTSSLKDGYAVVSANVADASKDYPVKLIISGMICAGDESDLVVEPGRAVTVMTGASIPPGADAVVAVEFTRKKNGHVLCFRDAMPGKNILVCGSDVAKGGSIAAVGTILTPAKTGFLAAGGISSVRVYPRPRVGIISTGDEVVAPGRSLNSGQLYASNLVTLISWLHHFGMESESAVVPDKEDKIRSVMEGMLTKVDVLLTSGGAWKSERDLTIKILKKMGGEIVFHRARLGPGKAVALILVEGKVVFCLPGGPPSNEMAFLQIALPGLLHMAGRSPKPFRFRTAGLASPVSGDITWTQFFHAGFERREGQLLVHPQKLKSRIQSQAAADALIKIPEGMERLNEGDKIRVQVLGTMNDDL